MAWGYSERPVVAYNYCSPNTTIGAFSGVLGAETATSKGPRSGAENISYSDESPWSLCWSKIVYSNTMADARELAQQDIL